MKIEITDEETGTTYSKSTKLKKVNLGRSDNCEIVIAVGGLSRKHVEITENDQGQYFITDLGSANGTFINDAKLEPNTPHEFNFFFPAQLGANVTIGLVEDDGKSDNCDSKEELAVDDASDFLASQGIAQTKSKPSGPPLKIQKPQVNRSKGSGALNQHSRRSKASRKKGKKGSTRKSSPAIKFFLLLCGIGGYLYYTVFMEKEAPPKAVVAAVEKITNVVKKIIPKEFVFPINPQNYIKKDKCLGMIEKEFCHFMPKVSYIDGASLLDGRLVIVFDATKEYARLKSVFNLTAKDKTGLIIKAKRTQGVKFSKVMFIKGGYKIKATSRKQLGDYVATGWITNKSFLMQLNKRPEINEVITIAYRSSRGKHMIIGKAHIKKSSIEAMYAKHGITKINTAFKYAFISGYDMDFKLKIEKYFNKP
jgi:pSer/pThr/pTyr-binding forkhead associated (FHA) protein